MIDRSIAVFSGVHPRVVEKVAPALRSTGIEPVVVSLEETLSAGYFERLAKQALHAMGMELGRRDVRLTSVLISSLSGEEQAAETEVFFPALRRVSMRPEWRNNPSAARQIIALVQDHFRSDASKEFTRRMAARREPRLLLPPRNTPSKALTARYREVYDGSVLELSGRIEKEVVVQRGGRGLKVQNLNFVAALNNQRHPVRRCTDSPSCDLKAAFRFGAAVPARFEFDVTAENGLKSSSFYRCDGSAQRIGGDATHLNMRINDDFEVG